MVDANGVILWVDRPFGASSNYFLGKSFWDFCGSAKGKIESQQRFAWTLAMGEPTRGVASTGGPIPERDFRYTFERVQVQNCVVVSRFCPFNAATLTPSEEAVCALLVQDVRAEDISAKLNISPNTFQVHRRNIMQKVGVKGLAGLTRWWEERARFST